MAGVEAKGPNLGPVTKEVGRCVLRPLHIDPDEANRVRSHQICQLKHDVGDVCARNEWLLGVFGQNWVVKLRFRGLSPPVSRI